MNDEISKAVLKVINNAEETLKTKEVEELVKKSLKDIITTKLFYRLTMLRTEDLIKGKFTGPGKGVWILWKKNAFRKNRKV